ncbi:MAG TPA: hypothetical protein VF101_01535 [Gaiellaceae bacterium]
MKFSTVVLGAIGIAVYFASGHSVAIAVLVAFGAPAINFALFFGANYARAGKRLADKETVRRLGVLNHLRHYYITSHDGISSEMMSGLAWPPLDWLDAQLARFGEPWSAREALNSPSRAAVAS